MHILVDARHLNKPNQSGVGEYTINILRALFDLQTDHNYTLLTSGRTVHEKHFQQLSEHPLSNIERNGMRSRQHIRKNVQRIHVHLPNKILNTRILLTKTPSLANLTNTHPDAVFLPNLNIVSLPKNTPYVLTVHDLSWNMFPEFYSKKMLAWHKCVRAKKLIEQSDHCICPSTSTKRDLMEQFDVSEHHASVIPHGVNPVFQPRRRPTDHGVRSRYNLPDRFIFYLGTLEPRKNIETIIEGVRAYRDNTGDNIVLLLAGEFGWKHKHIKRQINDPDAAWVRHLQYVPNEDRAALYREASVFLWPSIYEGFGLPVLESMACGTPAITSRTSSLPEMTQDAAILIDPHNINDIASALEQYFFNPKLQQHLSKKGIERANDFSWKQAAVLTQNTLENTQ